jgi:hypothetical protein
VLNIDEASVPHQAWQTEGNAKVFQTFHTLEKPRAPLLEGMSYIGIISTVDLEYVVLD